MENSLWTRRIHEPFIFCALAVALTVGFGYAALLVTVLAVRVPLGAWWGALVQAHGQAQLFGWVGLFVLGMGLYFLPRLRGTQLRHSERARYVLALLGFGIFARALVQPALGFINSSTPLAGALGGVWVLSALAELAGLVVLGSMLIATERAEGPLTRGSPEYPVLPFLRIAFVSLALAVLVNFVATAGAWSQASATLNPNVDGLIILLMLYGLILPMTFVFAVRNLPLFLRLAMPPREELRLLAGIYALGLLLRATPYVAEIFSVQAPWLDFVSGVGEIVQGGVILFFVWRLDLVRRRQSWTTLRAPNTRPDLEFLRRPTRANYPDAGEYGRFELLIYAAFGWLVFSTVLMMLSGTGTLLGVVIPIPPDAERHALTLGFVTLLIFGMGARMVPGFSHKKGLAFPELVMVTFIVGNFAALLRVGPLFLPPSEFQLALIGFSGVLAWSAVLVFAVNITRTIRS